MINDEEEFTKNKRAIQVKPGSSTHIDVTMHEIVADESLESLKYSQRQCILPSEYPNGKYSKSQCQLQCQVRKAEEKCGCISWKYYKMYPPDAKKHLCQQTSLNGNCFDKAVEDFAQSCHQLPPKNAYSAMQLIEQGLCPAKCVMTAYTYSISRTLIEKDNLDSLCRTLRNEGIDIPYMAHNLQEAHMEFVSYNNFKCWNIMEKTAMVTIAVVNERVEVLTQTRRATFASQIAALGGIAGLFTGMSILSIAEVIFWVAQLLLQLMNYKGRMKN